MNMLTNLIRFDLLNKVEQDMFQEAREENCEYWDGEYWLTIEYNEYMQFDHDRTYRLRLREHKYYHAKWFNGETHCLKYEEKTQDNIDRLLTEEVSRGECIVFRPATQEEIDSVKAKEAFVDCEIDWESSCILPPYEDIDIPLTSLYGIGIPYAGWILSGYVDSHDICFDEPIAILNNGTKLGERAKYARFIKFDEE